MDEKERGRTRCNYLKLDFGKEYAVVVLIGIYIFTLC